MSVTIGDSVKVKNKGISGVIVYETKNTFTIRTRRGVVVVPKRGNEFVKGGVSYSGDSLVGRVYERFDP